MKITNKTINYNVPDIDALVAISNPSENDVCVVTDENRGGTFIYRSAEVDTNNGGTIFDGWCRQYDGAVNVKWFYSSTWDNAITSAFDSGISYSYYIYENIEVSESITIPAYTSLVGAFGSSFSPIGTQNCLISSTASDTIVLSEGSSIKGFKIQNITGNLIKLVQARQASIEYCSIRGLITDGQKGLYTLDNGSWDIKVSNTWFTKLDIGIELSNSYASFTDCMITENNTNLHFNNGHYQFSGGVIAHSYTADCVAGDDYTGDFYSDYNCKVVLTGVHLEANSSSTHTKFEIGSSNGSITNRVSLVTNGLFIANNMSNAIWFNILSGNGSKINIESITGVDASYIEPVVKIEDTATTAVVSQIYTYPIDKALKISYTDGRDGINILSKTNISGKYTPVVTGGSVAGTGTYSSQTGGYTLYGNTATVSFSVYMTAHTGTGDILISLPFTSATSAVGAEYYVGNVVADNITLGTGSPALRLNANSNKAIIKMSNSGASSTTVSIDGTGYLIGTITYQIA